MINIIEKDIINAYSKIKNLASARFANGNIEASLQNISTAAHLAYLYNFFYKDTELEKLLQNISSNLFKINYSWQSTKPKYLIIDYYGLPNRGLSQQYLQGIISTGNEFMFIAENPSEKQKTIHDAVINCKNGTLYLVPNKSKIEQIQHIYNQIITFQPSIILAHISPWDVVAVTVLYSFPNINKFNINITDHGFWLGAECFNYTFEFREYGCNVSILKRGLKENQVLLNPFYPIIDNIKFQGFPIESQNKVIILTGGSYYKIYGDNGIFLKIMKRILVENSNAVILFAGTGTRKKPLINFIKKNKLNKRLILLGYREDINQVFANCDLYLGTYPIAGGLMTQYAVYNTKPVIAYSKSTLPLNNIEDLIFRNDVTSVKITYSNIDIMHCEINKLIKSDTYRKLRGELLKKSLITQANFNDNLNAFLKNPRSSNFNKIDIDFDRVSNLYMDINNKSSIDTGILLLKNYITKSYFYFPKILLKYSSQLIYFAIKSKLRKIRK